MPKINPRIKSIDDLLGLDATEESRIESTPSVSLPVKNTIITLPPQAIRAFRGHPFRLYEGDRLNDLVERRVNFILDEYGNFTPISDMTNKLTVAAGRGMRYALFVQGFVKPER